MILLIGVSLDLGLLRLSPLTKITLDISMEEYQRKGERVIMKGSTLLAVFESLLNGDEIDIGGVDVGDEEQLKEFLDRVFKDPQLKRLAIFDTPVETLRELLRSQDINVRMSAAYTLMDRKFPQLNLISYV